MAIVAAVLLSVSAVAETVSQKEAKQLAQQFFNEARGQVTGPVTFVYNGKNLTTARLFTPFYVYNSPSGGFVIISAENKTFPILGYSLTEHFDKDKLGEGAKALLREYARDIEYIRYDSRVPEQAIEAWRNYPQYVSKAVHAPSLSGNIGFSSSDVQTQLDNLLMHESWRDIDSQIYTPAQWQEMVERQLISKGEVSLGVYDGKSDFLPMGIYGRKGDYYSVILDGGRLPWMMRLMASELLSDGQVGVFTSPIEIAPEPQPEEVPFAFYDGFVEDTRRENEAAALAALDMIEPQNPVVRPEGGGGRFTIFMPEPVWLVRTYNLSGAIVGEQTYKHSREAHIDLGHQPGGFYVVMAVTESGIPYSFKLYR